ncbi:MAG: GTP-binding protein [Microbacterium sp.]
MDAVDVIAVVGACGPERRGYAQRLAQLTEQAFLPASGLAGSPDPAQDAVASASRSDPAAGAVLELPDEVSAVELIGAFAADEGARLLALVCVVDAVHVLADLDRQDHLPPREARSGVAVPLMARAHLTVAQIEYASTIVLVNWSTLAPSDLTVVMALLNHVSPRARLRLHRDAVERLEAGEAYSAVQDRPGWVCLLNGDFDPHMGDPRVTAFRYEQVRPLHPGRLKRLLDERIESGEFGAVVRSAGFCRLATRPRVVAQWDHVGRVFSLNPLAVDDRLEDEEELLALGQDLAIVGIGLDRDGLTAALDEAALSDEELAAGPAAWAAFPDPFPFWALATERSE